MSTHSLSKKRPLVLKQFNWRALLVRVLVNALTLIITTLIVPSISFVAPITIWKIILLAIALGLLNALIKPIIQFLTLSYIFATYGLVVILINTIILYMLSWLLPGYFHVANFLWAFVGGAVMGILAGFLESVFGLTLPIVDEESVSEAMRKAAEFNERRQQAFPFKEIKEEPAAVIPIPGLTQTETAEPVKIVRPEEVAEPVPVAAAPASEEAEPPEEAQGDATPEAETSEAESARIQEEPDDSAPESTPETPATEAEVQEDAIEEESKPAEDLSSPQEEDIPSGQDDAGQGGAA